MAALFARMLHQLGSGRALENARRASERNARLGARLDALERRLSKAAATSAERRQTRSAA